LGRLLRGTSIASFRFYRSDGGEQKAFNRKVRKENRKARKENRKARKENRKARKENRKARKETAQSKSL
jgi:uncharacterized protein (DUF3084 family)